jgi:hypothetical protein
MNLSAPKVGASEHNMAIFLKTAGNDFDQISVICGDHLPK